MKNILMDAMQAHAIWILMSLLLVTVAMILDLITGVRKANSRGNLTTSSGFRKTASKATKYYLPILCCSVFDLLFSPLGFYNLPYFAMFMAAFCICCEIKSVFENTRNKDEIEEMATFLTNIIKSKDNSGELLEKIVKNVLAEKTKTEE